MFQLFFFDSSDPSLTPQHTVPVFKAIIGDWEKITSGDCAPDWEKITLMIR